MTERRKPQFTLDKCTKVVPRALRQLFDCWKTRQGVFPLWVLSCPLFVFLHAVSAMAVSGCYKSLPVQPQPVLSSLHSGASSWSLVWWRKCKKDLLHHPGFAIAQAKGRVGGRWAETDKGVKGQQQLKKTPTKQRVRTKRTATLLSRVFCLSLLMMFCGCFLLFLFFSLLS